MEQGTETTETAEPAHTHHNVSSHGHRGLAASVHSPFPSQQDLQRQE